MARESLSRQSTLKENMLEIYIFKPYVNIFRPYFTDLLHMLLWRREDTEGNVAVVVSIC